MEKRTPHYCLEKIKKTVADNNSRPFTMTALRGGLELGLTEPLMREVVLKLTRDDFYKSMTTHSDHRLWQDVYQGKTPDNIPVYIKITAPLCIVVRSTSARRTERRNRSVHIVHEDFEHCPT